MDSRIRTAVAVSRMLLPIFLITAPLDRLFAQQADPEPSRDVSIVNQRLKEISESTAIPASAAARDYRIGPEDLIEIAVFEVPELSRTVRVSASGEISLPLIGAVKAAGLSPAQMEQELTGMLRGKYLQDPQVSVFLKEYKSAPVSVVGAVKMPGSYFVQTQKSLIEVLAMAQGFSEGPQRHPGRTVIITHPLGTSWRAAGDPATSEPGDGQGQIQEIPIKQLLESGDPKWNVSIYPGDVIRVVPAGTYYVAGNVVRPGGFLLTDFENLTVIQALAMAGGPNKAASLKNAVIIRRDAVGTRTEEKIDLKRVMQGKDPETLLGANDILFVPGSVGKEAALRAIESSIQIATGMLIWR